MREARDRNASHEGGGIGYIVARDNKTENNNILG